MENSPLDFRHQGEEATGGFAQMAPGPQPTQPYRFTSEELRVLKQCNRESFYQRCLPMSTALGIGTYYAVQAGYLKPSVKWGATPKICAALAVGYFIGKLSYQSKCAEMLMRLPNSPMGEMLRRRKYGAGRESLDIDPGFGSSVPSFGGDVDSYSDVGPSHEIDIDRPPLEGLDDSQRPTLDSPLFEEDSLPAGTHPRSATYEELRRKNREEYEQRRTKQYRGVVGSEDVPSALRPHSIPDEPPLSHGREPQNKYGDVWEK